MGQHPFHGNQAPKPAIICESLKSLELAPTLKTYALLTIANSCAATSQTLKSLRLRLNTTVEPSQLSDWLVRRIKKLDIELGRLVSIEAAGVGHSYTNAHDMVPEIRFSAYCKVAGVID